MSRKNIDGSKGTVDLKIPHMFSLVQQGPLRGYYLCRQQSFTPETSWPQIPSPKGGSPRKKDNWDKDQHYCKVHSFMSRTGVCKAESSPVVGVGRGKERCGGVRKRSTTKLPKLYIICD